MFGNGRRKGHGFGLRGRRLGWALILAPALSVAGILGVAAPGQAMTTSAAQHAATAAAHPKVVKPNKVNMLDCNGYSSRYKSVRPGGKALCTDVFNRHDEKVNGKWRAGRLVTRVTIFDKPIPLPQNSSSEGPRKNSARHP